MNSTLKINDSKEFGYDIWQTSDCEDWGVKEWNEAIETLRDNAQAIYDWIDTLEDGCGDFDPYILGDLINMLSVIGVERRMK